MRNLHLTLLQEYRIEARRLFREWERLRLREIDYKNHRIFTLRCLHRDLVPVSLKLKSTVNTTRAKKIINKAEKELTQARIKSINNILTNVSIQLEQCRSQLASIISTERLRECQGFVDKVGKSRFNKVKDRQIKKFQNLVNKKQGNITWSHNNSNHNNNNPNPPQTASNTNRQAGAPPTSLWGRLQHPPARPLPPPQEGENLNTSTTIPTPLSQVQLQLPSQEVSHNQAIANLPQEDSILPLAGGPPGSPARGWQPTLYSSPSR